ncbi:MAG: hypothetical protein M9962_06175 [Oligoflexia bacterium]|nr:hypothetical protein [Oligoflexia bacterium]
MKNMTPWTEFTEENVLREIPKEMLGVFQLSKNGEKISYVGRSDADLRDELKKFLGKGYGFFQWVQLPWTKETFEMHCRLYHHAGGREQLDNEDHPVSSDVKQSCCPLTLQPSSLCEF